MHGSLHINNRPSRTRHRPSTHCHNRSNRDVQVPQREFRSASSSARLEDGGEVEASMVTGNGLGILIIIWPGGAEREMAVCHLDFNREDDTIILVPVCSLLGLHLLGDALAEMVEVEVDFSEAGKFPYCTSVRLLSQY